MTMNTLKAFRNSSFDMDGGNAEILQSINYLLLKLINILII